MKKAIKLFLVRLIFFIVKVVAVTLCVVIGIIGYFAEIIMQIYYSAIQIYTLSKSAIEMSNEACAKLIAYYIKKENNIK